MGREEKQRVRRVLSAQRTPPSRDRQRPRHCEVDGCGTATFGGKPYCSDHLFENPYAREVLKRTEAKLKQDERIGEAKSPTVDLSEETVWELLVDLRDNGQRTIPGLSRALMVPKKSVSGYVEALRKAGLVEVTKNKRGVPEVRATDRGLFRFSTQS